MDKRFLAIIGVLVAIFVGVALLQKTDNNSESSTTNTKATAAITKHIEGKKDATVKLVEYSDFQCPYCGLFYTTIEKVVAKYQDKISFEYRQYPLTSIHQNAFAASRATEAASNQGKFWEMYRLIFSSQSSWSESNNAQSIFEGYASQLGLTMKTYKADFASSKTNAAINASIAEFNSRGLRKATPTFLLNDKQIQPELSVESLFKLIDQQLAKSGQ